MVHLHGGPTLYGRGIEVVVCDEVVENHAEASHLHELRWRHVRRGGIGAHLVDLLGDASVVRGELFGRPEDFREIDRRHADAVALQNLLAVADGIEGTRASADGTDSDLAHASHDATDGDEPGEVGSKGGIERSAHVLGREGKRDAGLSQVVADGDFPAERIPAANWVQQTEIVGVSLNQHGDVQVGELQRVGDALFVTEVGQHHDHAIDAVALPAEQLGASPRVRMGLDAAELGFGRIEEHGRDAGLLEELQNVATGVSHQLVGKEVSIADDDSKN